MMKPGPLWLVPLLVLVAAPTASAQELGLDLTLAVADLAAPIPYSGSGAFSLNVTVGCLAALRTMSESRTTTATVTVALADPPEWLSATPAAVDVTPDAECVAGGTGYITRQGSLTVTVAPTAPAIEEQTLNFTASMPVQGDPVTSSDSALATVAYKAEYTLTTDAKFPLTVTSPKTVFNLTVTQASNARSMVMMEEIKTSIGSIGGLASTVYENRAGDPDSKVFKVTFTAPEGAWNKSTVSFKAYSHYLLVDGRAGEYDPGTAVTWEFVNGGIAPADNGGGGEDKGLPMPVAPMLALGLVALAAALRRRAP